jgi:hypothetical protein
VGFLERAFAADPAHPGVLNRLAEHCLIAGAHEMVDPLLGAAFLSTGVLALRAESCFHMARAAHARRPPASAAAAPPAATPPAGTRRRRAQRHWGCAW